MKDRGLVVDAGVTKIVIEPRAGHEFAGLIKNVVEPPKDVLD